MEIYIEHHIYNPGSDRETECTLGIDYSPFRKGDCISSWSGPTPDEHEEVELFEIKLRGWLPLCGGHRYFDLIGDDELFRLVHEEIEGIEAAQYDYEEDKRREGRYGL